MQSVIEYVSVIGDRVNQIGNGLAEPDLENEESMFLLNAYINQVEGSPDAFKEVDPPPALEDFYDAAVELLEHCSAFAELVGETVEDGAPEVPEDAVQELVKADESLAEMGVVMTAFLELHPMYAE